MSLASNYLAPIVAEANNGASSSEFPAYNAVLTVMRNGQQVMSVTSPLPESINMGISSQYSRPFAKPLSDVMSESLGGSSRGLDFFGNVVRATTGITSIVKNLSVAVWDGGSVLSISLPLVLHAKRYPKLEVLYIQKELMKLAAASQLNGILQAPGPYIANLGGAISELNVGMVAEYGGDVITLNIGQFFSMSPCIIDQVSPTIETLFDANGDPIASQINVTLQHYTTTTKEDLDEFFAPSLGVVL